MTGKSASIVKTGGIVFLLIVFGKIISLFREIYFSALFGTSLHADAYFTASIIPNLLNTPLTISSLVFFIPVYTKCREQNGEKAADRFTSNLMNIYVLFNTFLCVVSFLFAPLMIRVIVPENNNVIYEETVQLARLLVLSFPVTVAVHVLMNVSNANRKHIAPQLLTVLNGLLVIVLMAFFVPGFGIFAVPVIGLAVWVFQLFFQGYFVRRQFSYKFLVDLKDPFVRSMILLAIPVILATATEQINLSVDNVLASSLGTGSVSVLNYSQKLFNVLNGTVTTAIITVSYPIMSKLYAEDNREEMVKNVNKFFSIIAFLMLPIMLICMILNHEIVTVVFERGAFSAENAVEVGKVFMIYVAAAPFAAAKELVTRVFYIYEDSRLPMFINTASIAVNIILSIVFVRFWGVQGIVGGTVIATFLACIVEIVFFRIKYGKTEGEKYFSIDELWKYSVASLCMLSAIVFNKCLSGLSLYLRSALVGAVCLCVYIGVLMILREKNCELLMGKLRKKKNF